MSAQITKIDLLANLEEFNAPEAITEDDMRAYEREIKIIQGMLGTKVEKISELAQLIIESSETETDYILDFDDEAIDTIMEDSLIIENFYLIH